MKKLSKETYQGKNPQNRNLKNEDERQTMNDAENTGSRDEQCICEEDATCLSVHEPVFSDISCTACVHVINFTIEAISRHSLAAGMELYDRNTAGISVQCVYDIYVTFSIVYLFKRRVFARNHYQCTCGLFSELPTDIC